jgi:gentisate 1,2-dioxygenase
VPTLLLMAIGGGPDLVNGGRAAGDRWVSEYTAQCYHKTCDAWSPSWDLRGAAADIDLLYQVGRNEQIAGSALIFSADEQEHTRNILPTLTVAMNSLPGGVVQRPHRHNSVAVALVIKGDRCFSVIDGKRKDWAPWATTITPPVSVHSHHNGGNEQALFLIVQDGGIYYHTRAMGFEFAEHPAS